MINTERKKDSFPKVCVIIPAYNRAKFIRETIDSVLNQTYKNIELIVVDDGSTDDTMKILQEYGDELIVLQHPEGINKGPSATINLGMRTSNSKYVAILDSDDLIAPQKIELQVEYLEQHQKVGLVYTNGEAFENIGDCLYRMFDSKHCENNNPERFLLNCYFSVPSNSLVRRTAFIKAGKFDETLRSAYDHDMGLRLAEITRLAYIDKILWYYRKHSVSLSGRHAMRRWKMGFTILNKAANRYPYSQEIKRKRRAVLHFRLGQCFLEEKKIVRSLLHFFLAGIYDPARGCKVLVGKESIGGVH